MVEVYNKRINASSGKADLDFVKHACRRMNHFAEIP